MENQRYGKYQVLEPLGQGGFGTVYLGLDPELHRKVAIKTCNSADRHLRDRFRREARIAASLQHSSIVTVFDSGEENGVPYLVQEYLAGEDLSTQISLREQLPQEKKIGYLIEIARGLAYAHSQGVVHRDIKPANIRVLPDGRIKILDFGIAKLLQAESQLTRTGMTMGTAGYMPPEQILGKPVDQRADIFAFGVLAYELLTGRQPFAGADLSEIFYRILHEEPRAIPELWPGCPEGLAEGLQRCLEKNPDDRHPSFSPVVALLTPFVERPATTPEMSAGASSAVAAPRQLPLAWSASRVAGSKLSGWRTFSESAYHTGLRLRRMSMLGVLAGVLLVGAVLYGTWILLRLWRETPTPTTESETIVAQGTPIPETPPEVVQVPPLPPPETGRQPNISIAPRAPKPTTDRGEAEPIRQHPQLPAPGSADQMSEVEPDLPLPPVSSESATATFRGHVAVEELKGRAVSGGDSADTPRATTRIVVLIRGEAGSGAATTEGALLRELEDRGLTPEAGVGVSAPDRDSVFSGNTRTIAKIAQRLGADLLLAGELTSEVQPTISRFFAGRAVLEVRLYRASDGRFLRAETVQVGGAGQAAKPGGSELAARTAAAEEVGKRAAHLVATLTTKDQNLSLLRPRNTPRLARHSVIERDRTPSKR